MITRFSLLLAALCGLISVASLHAHSTAFTYQGRLNDCAAPANGSYDLKFTLFANATTGDFFGPLTNSAVAVSNGLFTVLLDFGPDVFNGQPDFFLEIGVRPPGGGAFTTLSPRQSITPAPYAIHAAKATELAHGAVLRLNNLSDSVTLAAGQNVTITPNGNTLTIASPAGGIGPWQLNGTDTFYNAGNVGVGTTSPLEKLDVRSGDGSYVRVDSANGDIKANGGSDGHFGIFNDNLAVSAGTHLIGQGQSRLFVQNGGNVGIGTITPVARLEVRGDIRLGPSGQLRAPGAEENLRIVRGTVDRLGNIVNGTGFTVFRAAQGDYGITFTTPFADPPVVTASYDMNFTDTYPRTAMVDEVTAGSANVVLRYIHFDDGTPIHTDGRYHFIAIGPR